MYQILLHRSSKKPVAPGKLRTLVKIIALSSQLAEERHQLLALDDDTLKDVGLSRYEISRHYREVLLKRLTQ